MLPDDNRGMTAATRTQYRYDHRLKKLVRETGNIGVALEAGVPRSTAYGWLGDSHADVFTIDVLERDVADLEREVVLLQQGVARGFITGGFELHRMGSEA